MPKSFLARPGLLHGTKSIEITLKTKEQIGILAAVAELWSVGASLRACGRYRVRFI
jgi:hypothetical protein